MAGQLTQLIFSAFVSLFLLQGGSSSGCTPSGADQHSLLQLGASSGITPGGLLESVDPDSSAIHTGEFLLISSPSEKKVVWVSLSNFESPDGRAFALVDSGLDTPKGLAFDRNGGHLYVADSGAKKIFRYTVLADTSGSRPILSSGSRLTISEGHPVEWVTMDREGNLFYTAPDTKNINKITAPVLNMLAKGEFHSGDLKLVSQKELQANRKAAMAMRRKSATSGLPNGTKTSNIDPDKILPQILSIYEANVNPHVASPAAVSAQGDKLFWTNEADGLTAGTIVQGSIHPDLVKTHNGNTGANQNLLEEQDWYEGKPLTKVSTGAFGLAISQRAIFFTRDGPHGNNSGLVSGLLKDSDIVLDFIDHLTKPRGLVFDNDQTMYVADQSGGNVWSFPTGRMMAHAPLTLAVAMKGAYGLAILSTHDPCFNKNQVSSEGAGEKEKDQAHAAMNVAVDDAQLTATHPALTETQRAEIRAVKGDAHRKTTLSIAIASLLAIMACAA